MHANAPSSRAQHNICITCLLVYHKTYRGTRSAATMVLLRRILSCRIMNYVVLLSTLIVCTMSHRLTRITRRTAFDPVTVRFRSFGSTTTNSVDGGHDMHKNYIIMYSNEDRNSCIPPSTFSEGLLTFFDPRKRNI